MEQLPFEEDLNGYYEGDVGSLPLDSPIEPVMDWPEPPHWPPTNNTEAPNGWGTEAQLQFPLHQDPSFYSNLMAEYLRNRHGEA